MASAPADYVYNFFVKIYSVHFVYYQIVLLYSWNELVLYTRLNPTLNNVNDDDDDDSKLMLYLLTHHFN